MKKKVWDIGTKLSKNLYNLKLHNHTSFSSSAVYVTHVANRRTLIICFDFALWYSREDNVSSCLTRQCFILPVRLSDKTMFHPVCPFVWQDNVSSCLSICLTRQCFILSVRLSHFPSITKVCTCNFSYILNRNSLKLGRLTYFHMKNCILLQQFDRTIFEEVVLFTKNISSKVVSRNLPTFFYEKH